MSSHVDQHLLELINGFLDGELDEAARAKLRDMMAQDGRLSELARKIQVCRQLVGSLGAEKAPADTWQRVSDRLERDSLFGVVPSAYPQAAGPRRTLGIWLAAAAAVLLLGALGLIGYSLIWSGRPADRQGPSLVLDGPRPAGPLVVAGRLELGVADLDEVLMFFERTLDDLDLVAQMAQSPGRRVYRLSCDLEGLHELLVELDEVWHRFEGATLFVGLPGVGQQVRVAGVRPPQIEQIMGQPSADTCMEVARRVAVGNTVEMGTPGRGVLAMALGADKMYEMPAVPKPVLTASQRAPKIRSRSARGGDRIQLTVVVQEPALD